LKITLDFLCHHTDVINKDWTILLKHDNRNFCFNTDRNSLCHLGIGVKNFWWWFFIVQLALVFTLLTFSIFFFTAFWCKRIFKIHIILMKFNGHWNYLKIHCTCFKKQNLLWYVCLLKLPQSIPTIIIMQSKIMCPQLKFIGYFILNCYLQYRL